MMPFPVSRLLHPLKQNQCTSKWSKLGIKFKALFPFISSTFLHLTHILCIPLMKQSIASRHSSSITTPSQIYSPAAWDHFFPDMRSEAHAATAAADTATAPAPNAVLPPFPPWTQNHPPQIPLSNCPIFSQHIHLKIQIQILPKFQILHQVTLPDLNPLTFQNLFQMIYQQKNLH